ncbi:hypothetical protein PN465_11380 [Nodularia spumigena CS-584]|jgi:hypothetical protein|uniref:hypothetical protein n=1 Tax=Nodularia spumigena TaxID=70799 RepID=UPI0000EA928C|nr:hypothetical protein [Nodularia spumigena]AHJ28605.1 hypothetical protein NSP_22730 [Nodularia spumigena CCY9414]EAW43016.1 hypothetical protein N9414_06464 [Nodularia spumigena CCY9414]MDB9382818.1 hypothetical protein [Nodularia spumigena CS-584]
MTTARAIDKIIIALLLVLSSSSSVCGQQQRFAKRVCDDPVGRVINGGDLHLSVGNLICPEDQIQPANGFKVKIICYASRRILEIQQSKNAVDECKTEVPQSRDICIPITPGYCSNTRGTGETENKPQLITPYVGRILNTRPRLSWVNVPEATSYTIQVNGMGVNWSKNVQNTSLPYPSSLPAMQFGRIYQITIIANQGDKPVSANSFVTIVLPELEAQGIKSVIEQIESLSLDEDALAIDLDAVYMSKNLLTEAIGVLAARTKNGTQNPAIYRMLGDRYLETGLLETNSLASAKRAYAEAVKLARQKNDAEELAKAQAGVKLLESQSQAPTRTNAAQ